VKEAPAIKIERTGATLGAFVSGVDLASLDDAEWQAIEHAFHEHGLLIFPGQHPSSREQVAFARRFGEIEHLFGDTGIVPISNQRLDGSLLEDHEPPMQIMRGNEGLHTDSSYMPLSAYHSIKYSQARIGYDETWAGGYGFDVEEPPLPPLFKVRPVTGRPALFIGRHAYGLPGLHEEASRVLLDELLDFACRPPRTYQHAWQAGDVAIWDNRCVLHRARPYDDGHPRVMKHARIAGDPATEAAEPRGDRG
jgi:alpha-ketoglutarate-dependent taurine dioxygenase